MKKWLRLLAVFVVLVIVLLGGYYAMGVGTEMTLKRNISLLNRSNGQVNDSVAVAIESYQRGWFNSHATLKWTLTVPDSTSTDMLHRTVMTPHKVYTFEVPLDIHHGPVMWADSKLLMGLGYARTHMGLPAGYEKELDKVYNLKSARLTYDINILVSFLNKTTIQLKVPNYKLLAKKGSDYFQWLGLKTEIEVSGNKQRLQGNLALDGFSWLKNGIQGTLGAVTGDYDIHQELGSLYVGKAQISLPSLVVSTRDQEILRIINAQLSSESDIQKGLFHSSISASLSNLAWSDRVYSNGALDISFKNFDADVLAAINRKLNEAQRISQSSQSMVWSLLPDLPALLSKGAQLNMSNFTFSMPDGHVKADASLSLPNEVMTNPFQLLQKINGISHLRISPSVITNWMQTMMRHTVQIKMQKQVLNQAAIQAQAAAGGVIQDQPLPSLDNAAIEDQVTARVSEKMHEWIDSGVLVQDGEDYLIIFKLINGKLFINGHPFSPALLTI